MKIFNMYDSYITRLLPFAVNKLRKEKSMSEIRFKKMLTDILNKLNITNRSEFSIDDHVKSVYFGEKGNEDNIFCWENKNVTLNSIVEKPLPIVFSNKEKEYIRLMLEDKESRCFMSKELIEKLRAEFDRIGGYDVSHITDNYIRRETVTQEFDEDELRKHILIIADALRRKKKIRYVYASTDGEYEGIGSPYRLMYSLRNGIISLSLQPEGKLRFIKMNVNRFRSVELTDIDITSDPEEQFYKKQRRRIILEVDNNRRKKSVERCMRVFSSYKRKTVYNKEKDTVTLEIEFYLFDREAVISDIISLGSSVMITKEQKYDVSVGKFVVDKKNPVREEVKKRLKKMYAMYIIP